MNVLQSHHRDIPEQKDEKKEDQTGKNQKPDKNSLLGFYVHVFSIRLLNAAPPPPRRLCLNSYLSLRATPP